VRETRGAEIYAWSGIVSRTMYLKQDLLALIPMRKWICVGLRKVLEKSAAAMVQISSERGCKPAVRL